MGFETVGGDASQNWLILRNGDHAIGPFQDMFQKNALTFNPGWDKNGTPLDSFTRPASFIAIDPGGNQIPVDQHV